MSKRASPLSRLTAAVSARSPQPRGRPAGGGLWRYLAAAAGGLAAGAGAAHLIYSQGHKVGVELRAPRPEVLPPPPPTPADYDAKEPGRGRLADRPHRIPRKGWTDIVWRAGASYFGDRVGFVAGGVTFFTLLSLFPLLGSFVTLYGLFADPADAWGRLQFLYALMPDSTAEFLGAQMQRLAENSSTQLTLTLIWTLVLSLWAASGAVKMLFYGLNVAYHETEKRNFIRYNLVCLTFTIGALIAVLLTSGLVVGVPVVVRLFGLEEEWGLFAPLRWPLLFAGYVLALMGIYRYGPCRQNARWRWLTPGAIFSATLSVSLSVGVQLVSEPLRADRQLWPAGGHDGFPAVDLAVGAGDPAGRRAERRDRASDRRGHHHRQAPAAGRAGRHGRRQRGRPTRQPRRPGLHPAPGRGGGRQAAETPFEAERSVERRFRG